MPWAMTACALAGNFINGFRMLLLHMLVVVQSDPVGVDSTGNDLHKRVGDKIMSIEV